MKLLIVIQSTVNGRECESFFFQVKWGDRKGNFGEHYYDLNHHHRRQSNKSQR